MQLAGRLAAVLLALTWIASVAQTATVLRDFTRIDVIGRDPFPASALILDRGRTTRICSTTPSRIPAAATVADLNGKFVTPGLIDSYVHVGLVRDVPECNETNGHGANGLKRQTGP